MVIFIIINPFYYEDIIIRLVLERLRTSIPLKATPLFMPFFKKLISLPEIIEKK